MTKRNSVVQRMWSDAMASAVKKRETLASRKNVAPKTRAVVQIAATRSLPALIPKKELAVVLQR
jgi:hypothetical protein